MLYIKTDTNEIINIEKAERIYTFDYCDKFVIKVVMNGDKITIGEYKTRERRNEKFEEICNVMKYSLY